MSVDRKALLQVLGANLALNAADADLLAQAVETADEDDLAAALGHDSSGDESGSDEGDARGYAAIVTAAANVAGLGVPLADKAAVFLAGEFKRWGGK